MKKLLFFVTLLALTASFLFTVTAATPAAVAADKLNKLDLLSGVGPNADGTPNFDLDRAPTRSEAITMLVRLLGKAGEAEKGTWVTPFTDVQDWAKPYVGYAYNNGLTSGTGATTFGGKDLVTASQYLTFVLRSLGYTTGSDFQWDTAWTLSDRIGLTAGEYNTSTNTKLFTRGNVASISYDALLMTDVTANKPLYEVLLEKGAITDEGIQKAALLFMPVTAVSLDKMTASLVKTTTLQLTATVSPSNANNKAVSWSSSNAAVASVDNKGLVTAIADGEAIITAKSLDGSFTATCQITVQDTVLPTNIILTQNAANLLVGDSTTLTIALLPSGADANLVTWTSSDPKVAAVENGVVTAIGEGTAIIRVQTINGLSQECIVGVGVQPAINVPQVSRQYGPLTVTNYHYTGEPMYINQIQSLVFTKAERLSKWNEFYQMTIEVKGIMNHTNLHFDLYFYDAEDKLIAKEAIVGTVKPNLPYSLQIEKYIPLDIINKAVRMEIWSSDGHIATPGTNAANIVTNSGKAVPGADYIAYTRHPFVPDFSALLSAKLDTQYIWNETGTSYIYSTASIPRNGIAKYQAALAACGFELQRSDNDIAVYTHAAKEISITLTGLSGAAGSLSVLVTE